MRTTKHKNLDLVSLALVALSILIAPIAKAECGSAAPSSGGLSPALRSLPNRLHREKKTIHTRLLHPMRIMTETMIRRPLFSVFGRRSITPEEC